MRILAAIVLMLWTACYGRCLAQQCGALSPEAPLQCKHLCCQQEEQEDDAPAPVPTTPCGVCDFIHSGGVLPETGVGFTAQVPDAFVFPEVPDFALRHLLEESDAREAAVLNTGPPQRLRRLCEWMAGTSLPVRGPDIVG